MKAEKHLLSLFIILLWLCGFQTSVQAQQRLQYTGPLNVMDYFGDATFSYNLANGDTILNGPFRMERTDLKALLEGEDTSLYIRGNFLNNYPEGEWVFRFGEFQTEQESQVVDYQYRVKVNGIQHEATGKFINGKPEGPWEYAVRTIRDSEIDTTLFLSTAQYQNGKPQKSFRIGNKGYTLVGRTINNGLAHDQWSIYSNDGLGASENWSFEKGILRIIEKEYNGETQQEQVYSGTFKNSKVIALDQGFFNLIRIRKQSRIGQDTLPAALPELLKENAAYYQKLNLFLNALGTADLKPGFQVVVPYFPMKSEERSQLDSIKQKVTQAKEIANSLLNDTHLNILSLTDEKAAFLQQVIIKLSEHYVEPLHRVSQYLDEDILEYVPRTALINYIWPDGFPSTLITLDPVKVKGGAVVYQGPRAEQYAFRTADLQTVLQMAQYVYSSLSAIDKELSVKLKSEKRQQEFINLEEQLIQENKELIQLIDSLSQENREDIIRSLQGIKTFSSEQLSAYASLEESEAKLRQGRQLLACFTDLKLLARSVGGLARSEEAVNKLYQDAVWNPFLFVIMNEEVKKRITTAYRKIVVPYLLNQIETELSCTNAGNLTRIFEQLDRRILEMREEDTAKLERKLRREQDPETILRLFQIQSNTEE